MGKYVIDIFICIVAILLIIIVMLSSSKDDINDAFNGSKSDLFKELNEYLKTKNAHLWAFNTLF